MCTEFFPPFKTFFSTKNYSQMTIWLTTALNKSNLLTRYLRSPLRSKWLWFHPKLTCQCTVSAACCREAAIQLPLRLLLAAVIPVDDVNLRSNNPTMSNTVCLLKARQGLSWGGRRVCVRSRTRVPVEPDTLEYGISAVSIKDCAMLLDLSEHLLSKEFTLPWT